MTLGFADLVDRLFRIDRRGEAIERRQEALIQAISSLADTVRITNAMVGEMMEWLKKPPSNDLADAFKALAAEVVEMRREIGELPAKVARAVTDGEV
jgi:SOS-response transcriptional repressor LexA